MWCVCQVEGAERERASEGREREMYRDVAMSIGGTDDHGMAVVSIL